VKTATKRRRSPGSRMRRPSSTERPDPATGRRSAPCGRTSHLAGPSIAARSSVGRSPASRAAHGLGQAGNNVPAPVSSFRQAASGGDPPPGMRAAPARSGAGRWVPILFGRARRPSTRGGRRTAFQAPGFTGDCHRLSGTRGGEAKAARAGASTAPARRGDGAPERARCGRCAGNSGFEVRNPAPPCRWPDHAPYSGSAPGRHRKILPFGIGAGCGTCRGRRAGERALIAPAGQRSLMSGDRGGRRLRRQRRTRSSTGASIVACRTAGLRATAGSDHLLGGPPRFPVRREKRLCSLRSPAVARRARPR
jgi:hypothetical protein